MAAVLQQVGDDAPLVSTIELEGYDHEQLCLWRCDLSIEAIF